MKQTTNIESTVAQNSDKRNAGMLFFVSGMEFLLVVTIGEAAYTGYNVHANTISDLGATGASTFWFYEPAILGWGLFWFLGAYFLFRNQGRRRLMVLNLLPGIGILIVGLAPENISVAIHSIGTVIAVFFGAIVAVLSYKFVRSPLKYLLLIMGILSLFGILVEFGAYNFSFMAQTLGPGGWERVIAYPLLIWEMGFGASILTENK